MDESDEKITTPSFKAQVIHGNQIKKIIWSSADLKATLCSNTPSGHMGAVILRESSCVILERKTQQSAPLVGQHGSIEESDHPYSLGQ